MKTFWGLMWLGIPVGSSEIALTGEQGQYDAVQRLGFGALAVFTTLLTVWFFRNAQRKASQPAPRLDPKRCFTREDFVRVAQRDGLHCVRAGCRSSNLQVDHIIPWSHGGSTDMHNAQLLCATHNASKGNRFVG